MTAENPYTVPTAQVSDPSPQVPDNILKQIKQAWAAAVVSGCITLLLPLVAMSGTEVLGFSAWEMFDVALIFGLAFGIYKKSRACAVGMLCYFFFSKIYLVTQSGKPMGFLLAIVFSYYFWQGVSGTFAYHKFKQRDPALVESGG